MYYLRRATFLISIFIGLQINSSINQSIASSACEKPIQNTVFRWIVEKISTSEIANAKPLSCEEIKEITSYQEEVILITSGRKRGEYTICLSDDKLQPCKHTIATLIGWSSPSEMLEEVFDYKEQKSSVFNETVERLFLKPSSLIR